MAKYYGGIGFALTSETVPGVWKEEIKEVNYYGEILQDTRRWASTEHLNDDIEISNRFSIISDPFISANIHTIRYLTWMNVKWKVTSVEVAYPRLILSVGGVYNGEE